MNSRERLHRCYYHEQLDRPAVYIRAYYSEGDPTYDSMWAYLAENTDMKGYWGETAPRELAGMDKHEEPYDDDFKRVVQVLHTPAGDLRQSYLVGLKGQPGLKVEHLLKDRADAEKLLSLPLPQVKELDCSEFHRVDGELGDRGITDVCLRNNPGGWTSELFGSETFAMMSITDRDILHELCLFRQKHLITVTKQLISQGIGPYFAILGQEVIAPPLHGPKDFWDFNVQYDKPIIDLIHEAGGRMHVHCHGSVKRVMDGFLEMGADVLHPFEAPPMGDITAAEAKAVCRGRICLEGNIQIADLYERTPDEIRQQTAALIADAFDDSRGLIVCPSASPYIPGAGEQCLHRIKALVETVHAYQP